MQNILELETKINELQNLSVFDRSTALVNMREYLDHSLRYERLTWSDYRYLAELIDGLLCLN